MSCNCINSFNNSFEKENFFIPHTVWTRFGENLNEDIKRQKHTVIIQVNKLSPSNKKLPKLIPEFCPFCGKKYEYEDISK